MDRPATQPTPPGSSSPRQWSAREPIAIVGIGCRFPGADSPRAFWQLLREGRDVIAEIPSDRFDVDAIHDPRPGRPGKISNTYGGFLDGVDRFDAGFFRIPPREAVHIDPQHRLLLEVAWEALEDAGQVPDELAAEAAGVFIGMLFNDYEDLQFANLSSFDIYSLLGGTRNAAAGRLSHALNLRGPSMVVDTGCSASLTATHLACQSLWSSECSLALAGGTQLILEPQPNVAFSHARMLASDGRCKFGERRADGIVRGEGVGVVVLKLLSRARADGDRIYALIRSSVVNHDGTSGGSMVTPGRGGQESLLREACRRAGILPAEVDYVEAHGTGTPVGDPVEITTLGKVFGEGRSPDRRLIVGSVKSNIGHTDGAAGIAGLIKAVLSLAHGEIPPSLHCREPNPQVSWEALRIAVQRQLTPWPEGPGPRRAGVSSFGMTGCNAHVVLEQAPPRASPEPEAADAPGAHYLLTLSAKTSQALADQASAYRDFLRGPVPAGEDTPPPIGDVCWTAGARRSHHEHRLALVVSSTDEALDGIEAFLKGENRPFMTRDRARTDRRPVFVFSGHGTQWPGMGRELMAREEAFRRALERCEREILDLAGSSLLAELGADEEESRLDHPEVTQAAIFAVQVALVALFRSWGIEPAAVIGHSLGEVAAAHTAGALSLRDAVRVVVGRSQVVMPTIGQGGVAVVGLPPEQVREHLRNFGERLTVAGQNDARSTVVSGEEEALGSLLERLGKREVFCRRVKIDYPSHSSWMDVPGKELRRLLADVKPRAGTVPIYSTVSGKITDGADLDAGYWERNLRQPVGFADGFQRLLDDGHDFFVEISGHPVLLGSMRQALSGSGQALPSMRRQQVRPPLLGTLGALYAAGHRIEWKRLYARPGVSVRLPTYPWQRQRYWIDHSDAGLGAAAPPGGFGHPLLGRYLRSAASETHFWESDLSLRRLSFLRDHMVDGVAVLPAAAMLEMVSSAAAEALGSGAQEPASGERRYGLVETRFERALAVPEKRPRSVQLVLSQEAPGALAFRLFSRDTEAGEPWLLHCAGRLLSVDASRVSSFEALEPFRRRCDVEILQHRIYQGMAALGMSYGPRFRNIAQLWCGEGEAVARLQLAEVLEPEAGSYGIHPALFDACLHTSLATYFWARKGHETAGEALVPVTLDELVIHRSGAGGKWCQVALRSGGDRAAAGFVADIVLRDGAGSPVLEVRGLRCEPLASAGVPSLWDDFYRLTWQVAPRLEGAAVRSGGGWVILADESGVGEALAGHLGSAGDRCLLVRRGRSCRFADLRSGSLPPDEAENYRLLVAAARDLLPQPWRGIVHLWSLDGSAPEGTTCASLESEALSGCVSATYLVQALVESDVDDPPRVVLVTRGAQPVPAPSAPLAVAQACLPGLGRVIASEHPELSCRLIDLPLDPDGGRGETGEIEALAAEIRSDDGESQVALRDGQRFVARLRACSPPAVDRTRSSVRSDRSYLITGGLGGLGLEVAKWLVRQGARHLVLMGRSQPSSSTRTVIERLQESGAQVLAVRSDIAVPEQLAAALDEVSDRMPPLTGVFHSAGVLDDKILRHLDRESFRAVMAPKVLGGWNLHALTAEAPLDVFVLFSSASAIVGSPGQGNYVAANAFLDALAHHRRALGLPGVSIDWGAWAGIGMAATVAGDRQVQRGFRGFTPEQGVEALGRLLRSPEPQVAVMPFDWESWRRSYPAVSELPLYREVVSRRAENATPSRGDRRQALLAAPPEERRARTEEYLRELLARLLGFSATDLDPGESITSLGVDSLMAVELKNRLEMDLEARVSMVKLLQGLSVSELARTVVAKLDSQAVPETAKIEPAPRGGKLPLTSVQERMWFMDQVEPGSLEMSVTVTIEGPLSPVVLRRSVDEIVRRHEVLRTQFANAGGQPAQLPGPPGEAPMLWVDLAALSETSRGVESRLLAAGGKQRFLDLESGFPIRMLLVRLSAQRHLLLVTAHHIVMDAWSWGIFMRELAELYCDFSTSGQASLPRLPIQYADFACWQRRWLQGEVLQSQLDYWRDALAGAPPVLDLPTDRPRPPVVSRRGGRCPFVLPAALAAELLALSRREGVTVFMCLLAAFNLLLSRYARQVDVVVGVNAAGRSEPETEGLIGCFVNTLALRTDLAGNPTFRELLARARQVVLSGTAHQDAPYDEVVKELRPERRAGRTPLFQVMFDFGNVLLPRSARDTFSEAGLDLAAALEHHRVRWDLHLYMEEQEGEVTGVWSYTADLFDPATIARMVRHFTTLLASAVARPDAVLSDLEMYTDAEKEDQTAREKTMKNAELKRLLNVKPQVVDLDAIGS